MNLASQDAIGKEAFVEWFSENQRIAFAQMRVSPSLVPRLMSERPERSGRGPFRTDDWGAVWIGLTIIVVAYLRVLSGTSIKWLAIAPAKWSNFAQAATDLSHHIPDYAALSIVFAILFGTAAVALGQRVAPFIPGFLIVFVASTLIFYTGVKPFVAFTAGVVVNVVIGYVLSIHVFGSYWASLGH